MIVYDNLIQGSEAWEEIRIGRATASQANQVLTPTGRLSASRIKYARKLARECKVKDPMEFAGNKYTDWGNDHEQKARDLFMDLKGIDVYEVGFCAREDDIIGCSPDGLIMNETGEYVAGIEIKCPHVDKHIEYLIEEDLPSEYKLQVHWSMATTGLNVWWFMSYFPELKPLIIKVERDGFTDKLSIAMDDFIIDYKKQRELVFKKAFWEGGTNE